LLDEVVVGVRDPGIDGRDIQTGETDGLACRGAVVVDGHDHDLACGSAIVGGESDAR
jgi:hypothetical protein